MLTEEQIRLLRDPNFAVVSTVRRDGTPQTSVVWIDWDGEHAVFNTVVGRVKERNLSRDPRVAVCVWDREDPYRYVAVEGVAELSTAGARDHVQSLARKYMGDEPFDVPPDQTRVIVRVTPSRVRPYGLD